MNKSLRLLLIGLLGGLVAYGMIALIAYSQSKQMVGNEVSTGTIIQGTDQGQSFLGIRKDFSWRDPFAHRYVRPTSLPTNFKVWDRISFEYVVMDVVGVGKWTVYIRIENFENIN